MIEPPPIAWADENTGPWAIGPRPIPADLGWGSRRYRRTDASLGAGGAYPQRELGRRREPARCSWSWVQRSMSSLMTSLMGRPASTHAL